MFKQSLLCAALCSAMLFAPSAMSASPLLQTGVSPATDALREEYARTQQPAAPAAATAPAAAAPAAPAPNIVKSSEDLASEFIDAALAAGQLSDGLGWNEQQKNFVAIGTAYLPMKGLTPDDFVRLRSMKFTEAALNAKRDTIQFIRTDISVENLVTLPNTGLGTEYDKANERLRTEIERTSRELESLLAEVDRDKAFEVGGISLEDLAVESFTSVCERYIGNIDTDKLTEKQSARLAVAMKTVSELETRLKDLRAKAEELRGQLTQENVNTVETFASMPLLGAMTIGSFESVVDGTYSVSVVLSWSSAQERFVRSVVEKKPMQLKPGKTSVGEYLRGIDFSKALGGRKFLDDKGQVHIIGFGAWPITGNSSAARRASEGQARLQAQSLIALALRGDISAHELAQSKGQELRGKAGMTETQVSENFAQQLSESVSNMQLQGVNKRAGKVVQDPFTGQRMTVVAMSMSVGDSLAAAKLESSNYESAAKQTQANQESRGRKDGMSSELDRLSKDATAYNEGVAQGRQVVAPAPAAPAAQPASQPELAAAQKQQTPSADPGTIRPEDVGNSSHTSSGTSTDAFGW